MWAHVSTSTLLAKSQGQVRAALAFVASLLFENLWKGNQMQQAPVPQYLFFGRVGGGCRFTCCSV